MNYSIKKNKIKILCEEFNPKDIFECGQVFSYKNIEEFYFVYPGENLAVVYLENGNYIVEILKGTTEFFVDYFDLDKNYSTIIKKIENLNKNKHETELFEKAVGFGKGIRILKQEFVETLVSFIFSANNNIKRFTNSLNLLRKNNGEKIITPFDDLIALSDATVLWNLSESTLRKAISYGKLVNGIDVCKFGKQWVVSMKSMKREYGNPTQN